MAVANCNGEETGAAAKVVSFVIGTITGDF